MFTKRTIRHQRSVTSVDTAAEALALSIWEKARVDMAYMSQLTGKTEDGIIAELRGRHFPRPCVRTTWQTADEYLSGNVRQKLREAQKAAVDSPGYVPNVEALRRQPKDLDASEIDVRLGATWIDKSTFSSSCSNC